MHRIRPDVSAAMVVALPFLGPPPPPQRLALISFRQGWGPLPPGPPPPLPWTPSPPRSSKSLPPPPPFLSSSPSPSPSSGRAICRVVGDAIALLPGRPVRLTIGPQIQIQIQTPFSFLPPASPPPPPPSHIGELAPMALCDTHVAGCGEHLPARGLRDDRIPGTDQAGRGGRHGQKLHSGFPPPPPRQGDARGSADARSSADAGLSWQKVQGREANRRRHRLTEPTTKALCHPCPLSPRRRGQQAVYLPGPASSKVTKALRGHWGALPMMMMMMMRCCPILLVRGVLESGYLVRIPIRTFSPPPPQPPPAAPQRPPDPCPPPPLNRPHRNF